MDKKVNIVFHNAYLEHKTGMWHPENPKRLKVMIDVLKENKVVEFITPEDINEILLTNVHTKDYISYVKNCCKNSQPLDGDTPCYPATFKIAKLSAAGAITAARLCMEGETAFVLSRPPGHHAESNRGCGFCYFNNVAISTTYLMKKYNVKKIMILDIDAHHGNGTQEIFYDSNKVLYVSLHQDPRTLFPGTGFVDEIGNNLGKGYTLNIPLPPYTQDSSYLYAIKKVLPIFNEFDPEVIITSFGFDAHTLDPLSQLQLSFRAFEEIIDIINTYDACKFYVLEGGYNYNVLRVGIDRIVCKLAGIKSKYNYLCESNGNTVTESVSNVVENLMVKLRFKST